MKGHKARKRYLIAESERLRCVLVEDLIAVIGGVQKSAERVTATASIAVSVADLVTSLAACVRSLSRDGATQPSWLQTIVTGAGLISSFWKTMRSH